MKKYKKGDKILNACQITISEEKEINGKQYTSVHIAKNEEEILANGWEIYENIDELKQDVLNQIIEYDKSNNVNCFYINEIPAWIDRDTRVSLMNSTTILKNANQETTTLWLNGMPFVVNCDLLIQLLGSLEVYALNCYNITEQHKSNVNKLDTIDDVKAYDFTLNYPDKLIIEL